MQSSVCGFGVCVCVLFCVGMCACVLCWALCPCYCYSLLALIFHSPTTAITNQIIGVPLVIVKNTRAISSTIEHPTLF